jgi:lysozyme family protein
MGLSTAQLRAAWKDFRCKESRLKSIDIGSDTLRVAAPTVDAWKALSSVLEAHHYDIRPKNTGSYNCRKITGGTGFSLHAYGIAIDVNSTTNPYKKTPSKRAVRFSEKPTQAERGKDVLDGKADTDMTRAMIADVLAIRTNGGVPVFEWGGNWTKIKDAMHFEMDLTPGDLKTGIDPETVRTTPIASHPKADEDGTLSHIPLPDGAGDEDETFERAHKFVAEFEGTEFVDHPRDPGGATKFGITRRTLARFRGREVSKDEVKALTFDEAKQIFRKLYWAKMRCGSLPGPLALSVYNVGVHAGTGTGARYLQNALNALGAQLAVDGVIGDLTIAAARSAPLDTSCGRIIDQYEAKLRAHPAFDVFGRGFMRRVKSLRATVADWIENTKREEKKLDGTKEQADTKGIDWSRLLTHLQAITTALAGAQATQDGSAKPAKPPAAETPKSGSELQVLIALLQQLDQARTGTASPAKPDTKPPLTPVNAALGQTVGTALDGKKTILGTIGVLATTLIPALVPIIPGLAPVATAVSTAAPIILPIVSALTGWGVLGKIDKWFSRR